MRALKIFTIILAIILFGCQPVQLPNDTQKPDVENTDPGENNPEGEEPGDNEEPQESYYVKVAQSFSDWSGDYIITYTSGSSVLVLSSYSDTKVMGWRLVPRSHHKASIPTMETNTRL